MSRITNQHLIIRSLITSPITSVFDEWSYPTAKVHLYRQHHSTLNNLVQLGPLCSHKE